MAGHMTLDHGIGVRIPAPQPLLLSFYLIPVWHNSCFSLLVNKSSLV
jgi:hypothetical protein